ncbi:hypothetical protein [Amycolatopsis sp. WAC 04197]|uniref:hypothetical protein n=1 Tax=Amycolatopsis sp. WAC 04197 TaxID=2203199 RepID=UPI001F482689|nr:hypothetical protein [Amycolatopsis sp. WAC 04197]
MNTTKQVGGALGLAILVSVAGPVNHRKAFLIIAALMLMVAVLAFLLPARRDGRVAE